MVAQLAYDLAWLLMWPVFLWLALLGPAAEIARWM